LPAERAAETGRIAASLKPITSPSMNSDLITAIALVKAALEGSLSNVEINLGSIQAQSPEDEAFLAQTRQRAAELIAQASFRRNTASGAGWQGWGAPGRQSGGGEGLLRSRLPVIWMVKIAAICHS
jgi:hypothetical protein